MTGATVDQGQADQEMPPIVLSPAEKKAALDSCGADLSFLLEKYDVKDDVQAILSHVGVKNVEKFAALAKDVPDLTNLVKDYMGLDPDASLEARVEVGSIVCAWNNAQARSQKSAEIEAEMDTKEFVKKVPTSEWQAMRAALDRLVGKQDDKVTPAKEYVEKRLAEVENNDYRAESLTEVVSRDEVDPDSLLPQWDSKGNLSVRRGATTVPEPSNPEALRKRLTIMQHAYQMVALRHTNRQELQGDYVRAFSDYKDFVLGEYVWGLNAKDEEGKTVSSPPWSLVLSYERAIRKEAAKKVREGTPYPTALREAWRDPTVKERHFVTPLALHSKRPAPEIPWHPGKYHKGGKDKGKGKTKKGGKSVLQGCATHTPEGDPVCYRFNTPNEKCKEKKCRFKHVCGICFGKHPLYQCDHQKRQPDTQGNSS